MVDQPSKFEMTYTNASSFSSVILPVGLVFSMKQSRNSSISCSVKYLAILELPFRGIPVVYSSLRIVHSL